MSSCSGIISRWDVCPNYTYWELGWGKELPRAWRGASSIFGAMAAISAKIGSTDVPAYISPTSPFAHGLKAIVRLVLIWRWKV